ncbi:UNVERIFIED_CONTAM: hypothetical protein Slati_1736400 [Sesamum latifolium]|uniref:Uncharacterized protein n=1 Tax=Sesamum latifolium TaxID=2727402 RepID=A0AAW2X1C1_9LAMI
MFSKHLRDEHRTAQTPPVTRSSRGTPSSSDQKGKRVAPALPGSSSKRSRPSSSAFLRSSSARPISTPPPPPLLKDLGVGSAKSPSSSVGEVYTHLMLSLEKDGAPGRAADLMLGALPSGDKRLMSSLSSEDLDHMLTLILAKVYSFIRGESLSRASGGSSRAQGEAFLKKFEDKVEHLQEEVNDLKEAKKESMAKYQKAEKEVKRLLREAKAQQEEHAKELWAQAEQVRKEFPETEEGKNFLETCWASRLAKHKKSIAYQKEVPLVTSPFLRFAFEACRQQFLAHGYPPPGKDTSFLDFGVVLDTAPDPFAEPIEPWRVFLWI